MSRKPIVAVLHAQVLPSDELMAPVNSRAEVRYTDEAGLARALDGADVLFLYDFLTDAVPGAWHAAASLQWLHIAAAGVDPVMFPEARDSDVTITNSRGVFDGAIAEYVLAQILSFAKDLPESLRLQQSHTWKHRESERIAGRTALIVGTGPIGRAVARLLHAVGMNVRGSGRLARETDPDFGVVTSADDLPEQLADADYVIAVAPLTEQTRHMFCAETFAAMKPGARFVNVGRGELVRTDDLVEALRSGTIAGAALDVFDTEPLSADHPLWDMPNVSITPHNSGDFAGWRDALITVFTDNFERWVAGHPLENVVDKHLGYVPSR
ncbi:D-2-hydroxyacid dehydrogenase [Rhodococcus tibetensis]|uniref:D-2-hydroxyacid dehydrogenase n=1 Tax=Rhodococcus tibetensis TaxID=2965064 RepID=A0ABT1Q7H0_9NOCA|nr:D-2-hydroxyacid dehydrogenase [Rhodococcus sp. FXJ9.536]MCQ4117675.1 D-2-hydroxyacid dehydrogenase [Rhodococcus sp. FXJ9.536]